MTTTRGGHKLVLMQNLPWNAVIAAKPEKWLDKLGRRKSFPNRTCRICGASFQGPRMTCSEKCRAVKRALARMKPRKPRVRMNLHCTIAICVQCGREFPVGRFNRYGHCCSSMCIQRMLRSEKKD